MKKLCLLLTTITIFIQPSFSATWEKITDKIYIDTENIQEENQYKREFWVKNLNINSEIFKEYEKIYNLPIGYTIIKKIINCQKQEITDKSINIYSPKNTKIDSYDINVKSLEWKSIISDSNEYKIYKYICAKEINNGREYVNSKENKYADNKKAPNFKKYMKYLEKEIKRNWYPPKVRKTKHAIILFNISKKGKLLDCKVYKSSGNKKYDNAAIEAVKKTAPFQPLPVGYKNESVTIQLRFDYNIWGK